MATRAPKRRTVEESLRLDAADLRRASVFEGRDAEFSQTGKGSVSVEGLKSGGESIRAVSSVLWADSESEPVRQTIRLFVTPCRYGGRRYGFVCPQCPAKCRVLYRPPGTTKLACRSCHALSYEDRLRRREPAFELIRAIEALERAQNASWEPIRDSEEYRRAVLGGIHALKVLAAYERREYRLNT